MDRRVEVVIASYNAAAYIEQTLQSVLAQGPDVHVRVMDDGSTDGTAAIVSRYLGDGRVSYRLGPNTGGPINPRNLGLAEVSAPYVAFFDADDVMAPGYLGTAVDLLDAHPQWMALVSDYRNFSADGDAPRTHLATCPMIQDLFCRQGKNGLLSLDTRTAKSILVEENFQITGSVVYRTEAVRRVNGCDERLLLSEDFDLLFRITNLGPIGVSTGLAQRRRLHGGNLSNDTARILGGKALVRKQLRAVETDPEIARKLDAAVARYLDGQAAEVMAADRSAGLRLLWAALAQRGGGWPIAGTKALVKSLLPRAARART